MSAATPTGHRMAEHAHGQLSGNRRLSGITWRSILISLLLVPLNSYWVIQMEIVRYSSHPTTVSLFFNAVFILLVLTALNAILGRALPGRQLRQPELLAIYSFVCVGSAISGHDFMEVLVPQLAYPVMYATPENNWTVLFGSRIPEWALVHNTRALEGYFFGNATLYTRDHLAAWLTPVLMWTLFVSGLLVVMLCINVIVRLQWDRREALTYPLTMLPVEMTQPKGELFRRPVFWVGFALAAGIDINNSLGFYFPGFPHIPVDEYNLSTNFTHPWRAMGWFPASFYPFAIGIGALMPVDFLFSCWFFYLFWKVERVVVAMLGFTATRPNFPYINQQAFGAYMMFFLVAIWQSRRHLAAVGRRALGLAGGADDSEEPASYRTAVLGLLAGMAILLIFAAKLGMSLWLAVAFFVVYFALSISVLRMRAEFGSPIHDLHQAGPDFTFSLIGGTANLGPSNLTAMSHFFWFNRAYRSHPMPHQLEGVRMQRVSGGLDRRYFVAMLLMGVIGVLAAFWAMAHLMYSYGATAKSEMTFGGEPWVRLQNWLTAPQLADYNALLAVFVGFGAALLLAWLRLNVSGWPFHPLGFAISSNWEINLVWMPLLVAWIVKVLILRYGGLQGFRKALPFFYGLILGQFVVGSLLNLITMAFGIQRTYMFWQ